jgi:hypothetical protein
MKSRFCYLSTALVLIAAFGAACAPKPAEEPKPTVTRSVGAYANVGKSRISTFSEMEPGKGPKVIGVSFPAAVLNDLPTSHSAEKHCADRNKDGKISKPEECNMWHEWAIPLPSEVATRQDVPLKWALINWNPMGHIPPGVYDKPHFDVHFYIDSIENVMAIEPGTCGAEFVRCDQFEIGKKPIPANYFHPDYKDVDAVAPAMGSHLVDTTGPEFMGTPFTRTWIYGVYDGRITFYEEMVTLEYLKSKPNACSKFKSPEGVEITGYYPTVACERYDAATDTYNVTLEEFVLRQRSEPTAAVKVPPPGPPPAAPAPKK